MQNDLTELKQALPYKPEQLMSLLKVGRTKFYAYQRPVEGTGTKLPDYIAAHCRTLLALYKQAPGEVEKLLKAAEKES